ncbi:MAG: glycosyltransferase family 9 protein [archaeon]|jgi:ADP-heptose:LPS heptosyltransferase|nr:glycosyltransferase family 9 protein [archaeon]
MLDKYRIKFEKSVKSRIFAFLLDTIGFPLLLFKKKAEVKTPKNILIIRKDEMGDNLLSTPMFEVIKKKYPRAKITLLTTDYTQDLFRLNPNVNRLLVVEPFWKQKNPFRFLRGLFSTIKKIKSEKFDVGIDPKGSIVNILMLYLSRIGKTISYYNVSGGKFMLTNPVLYAHQIPEVECDINLLKEMGITPRKPFPLPKLYVSQPEKKEVDDYLAKLNLKDFIYLYTTPSKPYKRWPIERFRDIIDAFPERQFLIGGLTKEKDIIESVAAGKQNIQIWYDINPRKMSYVFKRAAAILAVDGGPMHIAWSSNKNTVTLFGQIDLKLWGALNHSKVLCHCPESKQGLHREPLDEWTENNKYMMEITVDEVKHALKEVLARKKQKEEVIANATA